MTNHYAVKLKLDQGGFFELFCTVARWLVCAIARAEKGQRAESWGDSGAMSLELVVGVMR